MNKPSESNHEICNEVASSKLSFVDICLHLSVFFVLFFSFCISVRDAKNLSYILFFIQISLFYLILIKKNRVALFFLTPIMLFIAYVDISFGLGNFAYSHGIYVYETNYNDYRNWMHTNVLTAYVLFTNTILFYIDSVFHKSYCQLLNKVKSVWIKPSVEKAYIAISFLLFIFFYFVPFNVSFLGGSGSMSSVPKTISALNIIYLAAYKQIRYRFILYFMIMLLFATFSYESKREAMFFVFPVLLLESVLNFKRVNYKIVGYTICLTVLSVFLIIAMSLMRGYGQYLETGSSIMQALPYVFEYLGSELFLSYFFLNIETTYTYFHSMQAMEYLIRDPNLLLYGSSTFKFLFITIPSSICDIKPKSVIHLYTMLRNPNFRRAGGSWPPNLYAEMLWNFYFIAPIIISVFFCVYNFVFMRLLEKVVSGSMLRWTWLLYAYMNFIMYARGSGFEMYLIYIIFAVFFTIIVFGSIDILRLGNASTREYKRSSYLLRKKSYN